MKHAFILLSVIILFGCKKGADKKNEITYNYHGYIYKTSDSTPYANTSFICYQGKAREFINDPKESILPFTTNDSGYFSIEVVEIGGLGAMVCWPDRYSKYKGCPENNSYLAQAEYNKFEYDVGVIYMP